MNILLLISFYTEQKCSTILSLNKNLKKKHICNKLKKNIFTYVLEHVVQFAFYGASPTIQIFHRYTDYFFNTKHLSSNNFSGTKYFKL